MHCRLDLLRVEFDKIAYMLDVHEVGDDDGVEYKQHKKARKEKHPPEAEKKDLPVEKSFTRVSLLHVIELMIKDPRARFVQSHFSNWPLNLYIQHNIFPINLPRVICHSFFRSVVLCLHI